MQVQLVDQFDDLGAQRLVGLFVDLGKARILVQRGRDAFILHLGEFDIIVRDPVEGFQNPRLKCSFHRGKAHIGLFVVILVIIAIARQGVTVGVKLGLILAVVAGNAWADTCDIADDGAILIIAK